MSAHGSMFVDALCAQWGRFVNVSPDAIVFQLTKHCFDRAGACLFLHESARGQTRIVVRQQTGGRGRRPRRPRRDRKSFRTDPGTAPETPAEFSTSPAPARIDDDVCSIIGATDSWKSVTEELNRTTEQCPAAEANLVSVKQEPVYKKAGIQSNDVEWEEPAQDDTSPMPTHLKQEMRESTDQQLASTIIDETPSLDHADNPVFMDTGRQSCVSPRTLFTSHLRSLENPLSRVLSTLETLALPRLQLLFQARPPFPGHFRDPGNSRDFPRVLVQHASRRLI